MIVDEEILKTLFQFIHGREFTDRNRKVNLFGFKRRGHILEADVNVILQRNGYAQYIECVECQRQIATFGTLEFGFELSIE